jgi:hypothetical protein
MSIGTSLFSGFLAENYTASTRTGLSFFHFVITIHNCSAGFLF